MAPDGMKTKHVLLVGPIPPPIGGDTVSTLNVLSSRYWGERGFTLECINTSHGEHGVRVPQETLKPKDIVRGFRIFLDLVVKIRRADVIFLWANHRFVVTAGLPVIAWSRLLRRRVFVKPFGGHLGRTIGNTPPPFRAIVVWLLGKVSCVFPQTNALAAELVEGGYLPAQRVEVLPNFLPDARFAETRAPRRFTGRCVFFGQIKREKGVFDIIEALGGRDGVSCDFYGPVLERDRKEFLAAVSAHPNIEYRGPVQPGRVTRTAAAYDVLLLPTFHVSEGYPAVVLEAYAAGIPVIATRWLSVPDIVEDGVTGILIPVKSPAAIREAVERLRSDDRLYESMCRRARSFVQSFSETAVVGGILIPRVEREVLSVT
jgi:glycosyltransferase involved in cell wall biosynthesis